MVAALGAALAGADVDDAGRAGPQRQEVLGVVGDDAHVLHRDAVLVESPEQGEAMISSVGIAYRRIPPFRDNLYGEIRRCIIYSLCGG